MLNAGVRLECDPCSCFRISSIASAFSVQHYPDRMISGRRRSVIFFTVLGICLVAVAVTLNVSWIVLNWRPRRAGRSRHHLLPPDHRRHGAQHDLPGPRDPPQRAARRLHQRRHPRAEDAGRVDPAVPADAADAASSTRRSGASSTASCSRTATGCCRRSSRCCGPAAPGRAGAASRARASTSATLAKDCVELARTRFHLDGRRADLRAARARPARAS